MRIKGDPRNGVRNAAPIAPTGLVAEHWRKLDLDPAFHGTIAVRAKWLILAKRLHPDNKLTGNQHEFVLAKIAYERCMADCKRMGR